MIGPIAAPQLSGKWLAGALFVLVSVGLEYVPWFADWWDEVQSDVKRLVVAGAGAVMVAALVALHYAGAFNLDVPTDGWAVAGEALNAWLAFVGGDWAVWSLLNRAAEQRRAWGLPRKRHER